MPIEAIRFQRQLLVEGRTAVPFAIALLRKLGHDTAVQVHDFGGREKFGPFLSAFVKMPHFDSVKAMGVLIDAENEPAGTCQSVTNFAQRAGLSAPTTARAFSGAAPRFGYFVMPDENTPGMIETLCLRSVADNPAFQCVDEFFNCLASRNIAKPRNMEKARAHAFLAIRERAELQVGAAAHAGYWNFEHDSMLPLRNFLTDLANA